MPLSSPKQSSKKLPSSHLIISDNPESNPNSESSSIKGQGEGDQSIDQSITAGPSSPTRRRPNSNRRRSSSITAAAQLMSSYSSNHNRRRGSKSSLNPPDPSSSSSKGKSRSNDEDRYPVEDGDDADEHHGLLEEYEEFLPHPSQSYKPRPYHIAIVSCLAALGNGIPLPTVFSLYENVMCGIVGDKDELSTNLDSSTFQLMAKEEKKKKGFWSILFPPSPELPQPANCPTSEVASLTSFYSSTLAVTGALLSLFLLQFLTNLTTRNSTSTLGFRFKKLGRKPPLIILHSFLSLTYLGCAIFPLLFLPKNPILTAITLGLSRVLADANNGSPLMLLTQNYVFDTTDELHHASSLAFVDGFAQLGSFPSAAIGGWIAALTRSFWAPFYSAAIVLAIASVYIMTCVPESRKGFREGVGKEEEEEEEEEQEEDDHQSKNKAKAKDLESSANGKQNRETPGSAKATTSSIYKSSRLHKYSPLRLLSFLSPLLLFLPVNLPRSTSTSSNESTTTSRRKHFKSLLLPPLLFLLSLMEACYNVFILPALLLFNTDILNLSVIQNGLVVSGLQAVRGIWLIAIWPRLLYWWRSRTSSDQEDESEDSSSSQREESVQTQSRNKPKRPNPMIRPSNGSTSFSPQTSLPDQDDDESKLKSKSKRSGDLVPLMFSYAQATLGFIILASSRSSFWPNALIPIVVGTWILETGSGSHSCRTSLIVKVVGEIITEKKELELKKNHGDGVLDQDEQEDDEEVETSKMNKDQLNADLETSLLSSLQLLATLTLSTIPILTSAVYSWGLKIDLPETVWILKAVCSVGSFVLAGLVWIVQGW